METLKTKITIRHSEEKEIEIPLPHYRKSSCHFYKVISKDLVIQVFVGYKLDRWSVVTSYLAHAMAEDECTEKDFNDAFNSVMSKMLADVNGKEVEPLCEEIKERAVNDGILTNDTATTYGGTQEEQGMNSQIFDARYKK